MDYITITIMDYIMVLPIRERPPASGTLFRLEVYKRVGISQGEVWYSYTGNMDIN